MLWDVRTDAGVRVVTGAVALPGAASLLGLGIGAGRTTVAALLFVLAIVAATLLAGRWGGFGASVVSFIALNYLFTEPRGTFSVGKSDDLVALVVFLVVGGVIAWLTTAVAAHRARAVLHGSSARSLADVVARTHEAGDLDAAITDAASAIAGLLGAACEISIRAPGRAPAFGRAGVAAGPAAAQVDAETPTGVAGTLVVFGQRRPDDQERRLAIVVLSQLAGLVERSLLADEAREARLDAESSRIRRALLSAVSHDFRTPLAAIKTSITAARGDIEHAARIELIDTAIEEVERLERLVGNLLDLTRIRSGALAPEREPVNADDLIDRATAGLPIAGLRVTVRPGLPPLLADPVQLSHVLRNVLENASRHGRPPIEVVAAAFHDAIELRVIDHGAGVAVEERGRVFGELYRGGDRRTAGTGLGLAIARAIVEAHGGTIAIEGTPGGGATVVIRIPAAPARAPEAAG